MKKYRKPILDIVEFDNLDVMTTSGDEDSYSASAIQSHDEDSYSASAIQSHNELSLNQVEISPIPVGVTETPAPADPLEPTPADDENPAEDQTDDSAENPADDDDDDDELAAQTVPEDEVE